MISDAERREVARMLRELPGDSTYPDLIGVIADRDGWYPAADAADRLADLIEPVERMCLYYDSDTNHCGCYDTRLIDREALLELAEEMTVEKGDIWRWSRRIREACGERMDDEHGDR